MAIAIAVLCVVVALFLCALIYLMIRGELQDRRDDREWDKSRLRIQAAIDQLWQEIEEARAEPPRQQGKEQVM